MYHKSGIYKIVNTVNNKIYVGSAVNLWARRDSHFSSLQRGRHHSTKLQNAYIKYGKDVFTFEVIEYVNDKTELIKREQYYLDTLLFAQEFINNTNYFFRDSGYNCYPTAKSALGYKPSQESIRKFKETRREYFKNNPGYSKGKKYTEEHRMNISKGRKGKKPSDEVRKIYSEKKFGIKNKNAKAVIQLNRDGSFVKEWGCLADAARSLNSSKSFISAVCNGRWPTAHGFKWVHKEKYVA